MTAIPCEYSEIRKKIGQTLQKHRKRCGYTIEELSGCYNKKTQLDKTRITMYEKGELLPKVDTLDLLLQTFGISRRSFFKEIINDNAINEENDKMLDFYCKRTGTKKSDFVNGIINEKLTEWASQIKEENCSNRERAKIKRFLEKG